MEKCSSCNAPHDGSKLICAYCGCSVQDIDTAEAELRAVKELSKAAQELMNAKGAFLENMAGHMGGQSRKDKVLTFWQNAFVPRSFDAQDQLLTQVLSLTDSNLSGSVGMGGFNYLAAMKSQKQNELNDAMLGFADRLMATMKLHHAGEAAHRQRLMLAEKRLAKIRGTSKGNWRKVMIMGLVFIGLGVGSFFYILPMMQQMSSGFAQQAMDQVKGVSGSSGSAGAPSEMEAQCKGEDASGDCDDICRFSACAALCEEQKIDWACDAKDLLKAKRKKAKSKK